MVDRVRPEGIGKDQNHGNDEAVDGGGFDHGQADKKGPGDGVRLVRLLGYGADGLGDRPRLPQAGRRSRRDT